MPNQHAYRPARRPSVSVARTTHRRSPTLFRDFQVQSASSQSEHPVFQLQHFQVPIYLVITGPVNSLIRLVLPLLV